jgi:hypothetical protein
VILPGFRHRPGLHCGSTALCNALRARGLDLSEPLAFGLGAGLGFHYATRPEFTPSHQIVGRPAGLERTACEVLGAPMVERTAPGAAEALEGVRAALGRGLAPILSTDLSRLPYWRARTPFGGHRVVLAGLDEPGGMAWLADTDRPGVEEVSLEVLDAARASVAPPFGAGGRPWLEVDVPARPRPLPEAVPDALRRQAADMLRDADGRSGISALERFARELSTWPERARDDHDRVRCFRFAYQVIEIRGTGGSLFRRIYARFLREVEGAVPGLSALGLAEAMEGLAGGWTRLAEALRRVGEQDARTVPAAVLAQARAVAEGERRFYEDVASAFG